MCKPRCSMELPSGLWASLWCSRARASPALRTHVRSDPTIYLHYTAHWQEKHRGDPAALLCALSFATGLGFGGHIEHGLGSASLGLQIADALALADEEREAIFYGTLLKDVACTACSAGIAAFFPDEEQVSLADVILLDPSQLSDMIGWLSRYLRLDARFPSRVAKFLSFMVQCGPIVKETMRSHCEVAELFARQLGFPDHVQQTLRFQWE